MCTCICLCFLSFLPCHFPLSIISHSTYNTHLCLWSRYLRYLISLGPSTLSNISVFLLLVTSARLKWVMAVSDWVLCGIEARPLAISDCSPLPITQQEVISSMPGVLTPAASPSGNKMQMITHWEYWARSGKRQTTYRFLSAGSNRQRYRIKEGYFHRSCFCHLATLGLYGFRCSQGCLFVHRLLWYDQNVSRNETEYSK